MSKPILIDLQGANTRASSVTVDGRDISKCVQKVEITARAGRLTEAVVTLVGDVHTRAEVLPEELRIKTAEYEAAAEKAQRPIILNITGDVSKESIERLTEIMGKLLKSLAESGQLA